MAAVTFRRIREILHSVSLGEDDFAGDVAVRRVASFKRVVDELDTTDEPWVAKWLAAEHYKAGVLYAAAKINWSKEQSEGTHGPFNVRNRAAIIRRFNLWVSELQARLDAYESSSRSAADVASWLNSLEKFRADSVGNA